MPKSARKNAKNYETILPFSCCPSVFPCKTKEIGHFQGSFSILDSFNLWRLSPKNNLKRFLGQAILSQDCPGIIRDCPGLSWATPPVRLGLSGRNSGKTPETLSERFLEFPSRVRLGCPKPYNSRHLRLPERFQNYLPPSTAGDASFFRIGSGEGLSEPVMEFPAVLGVSLMSGHLPEMSREFCSCVSLFLPS